ncbi:MAG TPA: PilT/PilU family type 4a pilus ATPase [Acidimicrobiales bacterium]|jgi:twitching motility protein PilT|nr:PilT/PilU family type 4a pilus ATPase [Acidimicrobiales bacterium]
MLDLIRLLHYVIDEDASDLHLKAGGRPRVRIDGQLVEAPFDTVSSEELAMAVSQLLPANRLKEFEATNDADFATNAGGLGRFRGNAFRQRGDIGIVLRRVLPNVASIEDLGLPAVVRTLASEERGMVLVTGPTGSGKTTTLASMIEHINETRACNVVAIEDPIEIVHRDKVAIINQREIGTDTSDYLQAMRRVLRQDPDVILIGEMRDPETVWAALSAAETGHLVLSTLHTSNATETINRIVDFFPPFQQQQIRLTLASALKGVICQRLLEKADEIGRVPAVEVMVMTGRIADRIVEPTGKGETIEEMIAGGSWYGMQTFDQSLFNLYQQGKVTLRQAMAAASKPHDFRLALEHAGLISVAG